MRIEPIGEAFFAKNHKGNTQLLIRQFRGKWTDTVGMPIEGSFHKLLEKEYFDYKTQNKEIADGK